MKVIHFTLGRVNPNSSNGINRVIEGLSKFGNRIDDFEIQVVTLKKNLKEHKKNYVRDGFDVVAFNSIFRVIKFFKSNKENIDIVHLHNVWSYQNIILSTYLKVHSIPYIVTVHAGLMRDRVQGSNYFLKIIFQRLFQKAHLDNSVALHAISREEITNISEYTSNQNIFYIPNGIDTKLSTRVKASAVNNKINMGCLGRLAEEKNTIGLICAINLLSIEVKEKITLNIMGPFDSEYAKKCKNLVKELKLQKYIQFSGKVNSDEKWDRLLELDLYIQPSLSEGASLTILEAMYSGLPIIATRTCNVSYIHGQDFLKMVEPIPADIARGITETVNNIGEFKKSGVKGRDFVYKHYEWVVIAGQMMDIYRISLKD